MLLLLLSYCSGLYTKLVLCSRVLLPSSCHHPKSLKHMFLDEQ
ncbi:hypothetical protein O6H91_Y356400 [Diphasiastrum complanatum]|nr:hypothetical protein O6H91_Y356400 [Diphasiastrum complanatum]